MTKAAITASLLFAAWAADHYYNDDHLADGLSSMFSQMRHSFGW